MGWSAFCALFSQTHLVTLSANNGRHTSKLSTDRRETIFAALPKTHLNQGATPIHVQLS
jgi:hypothetical protein